MVTRVPLTLQTKAEVQELKSQLAYLLGDRIYRTYKEPLDKQVEIPSTVCSDKALSNPPARVSGKSLGIVLSFRNDGCFATIHLWHSPGEGGSYSLGAHAGWTKNGTEDDLADYWNAFDSILNQLGVLAPAYDFTCPCGFSERINGGHRAVREVISTHHKQDHDERRISTTTLVGQEVTIAQEERTTNPATAHATEYPPC